MSQNSESNSFNHFIAGFTGGFVATSVVHPLDLIKVRIQTNQNTVSTFSDMKIIFHSAGLRGFYRGIGPNLLGNCSAWGTYMYVFKSLNTYPGIEQPSILKTYCNASLAGLFSLVLTNPIWMIKVNMCLADRNDKKFSNIARTAISIYNEFGLKGFYKGFIPGFFGIFHGCIMITSYEYLKSLSLSFKKDYNGSLELNTLDIITISCLSKIIAAFSTYPYQVLRARLMMVYRKQNTILYLLKEIFKNESIFGFYKGLPVSILRVLPATCITLATYESMCKILQKLETVPQSH